MRRQRRGAKLLALILGLSLIAAACGGDDDDEGADSGDSAEETEGVGGRDLYDVGGLMMAHALEFLDRRPCHRAGPLGKPPGHSTWERLQNQLAQLRRRTCASSGVDLCRRPALAYRSHPRRGSSGGSGTCSGHAADADRRHYA